MRILHVVPVFSPIYGGGAPVVSYHQSRELAKRGHKVTIFTSDYELNQQWVKSLHQVKVQPFKTWLKWTVHASNFYLTPGIIKKVIEKIKYFDIIHIHTGRTFQDAVVYCAANRYSVPYVFQAHGNLSYTYNKERRLVYDCLVGYRIIRDASRVIALSQMEAQLYQSIGVSDKKIEIIPNGIDLSLYRSLPPKGSFRQKYGIDENVKIILYLGAIHKRKGIDFLINAYAHFVNSMNSNDTALVIAGPDRGYLKGAKSLAKNLGVLNKVIFTGALAEEEKVQAFVDSSIVVCPEKFNVYLLVPLEAAACEKPVVVSNTNYVSNIVKQGEFGFCVNYGDVLALAKVIVEALSNDGLLEDMGKKGRDFVFRNLNWSNVVNRLEKVYEEILENYRNTTRNYE
jgi:glycosyltransferase involved in cell wall biosynthesis